MNLTPTGRREILNPLEKQIEDGMKGLIATYNTYLEHIKQHNTWDAWLETAKHTLQNHQYPLTKIHTLPLIKQPDGKMGIFISAAHQTVPEKVITYPHDTPNLTYLGLGLPKNKTLIINGTTRNWTGYQAQGNIIINGNTGDCSLWGLKGTAIINGTTGDSLLGSLYGTAIITRPQKTINIDHVTKGQIITFHPTTLYTLSPGKHHQLKTNHPIYPLATSLQEETNPTTIQETLQEINKYVEDLQ